MLRCFPESCPADSIGFNRDNGRKHGNYYSIMGIMQGYIGITEQWKLLFRTPIPESSCWHALVDRAVFFQVFDHEAAELDKALVKS